jgi:DNA-binding beta-propeller fold protein YncE
VLTITAAVLSAVLLTAAVLLARDQGAPAGPAVPAVVAAANHAVRIDPSTYQPVAAVAVGTDPAATAAGGGLVWVANRQDGTVTEVDPATNQLQQTIPASGSWPAGQGGPGLAFASGSLWVANVNQRQVTRVPPDADPSTIAVDANPNVIAAAQDAVWVAGRTDSGGGLVARINAGTNQRRFQCEITACARRCRLGCFGLSASACCRCRSRWSSRGSSAPGTPRCMRC